jgi:exosortase A
MKRDPLPQLAPIPAVATAAMGEWRAPVLMLAVMIAGILAAYRQTAYDIVEIWSRSETFAHGFVVPVIVAWLIWRARRSWMNEIPGPSPIWMLPLAACGLAWIFGRVGTINAVSQLALVGMLVFAVPLALGTRVARVMAFPLAFLFFAVPIGEFMLPALMRWTADFTVYALRLTGVPVYREGQQIVIPSGRWSVVEACSGIRYLIASMMVGTLYAYLSFSSLRRRLIFIGVSILIPIVANWVRAYMIVMIGHLSSNRLAVGVDHIIYGWIFFGIVMLLMFWAGSFWREDVPVGVPVAHGPPVSTGRATSSMRALPKNAWLLALVAGCIALWPLALHVIETRVETAGPVTLAPLPDVAEWHGRPGGIDAWQPLIQSPSAELRQVFSKGGQDIGVHIAFFRDQSAQRKLVSSTNVLAAAGAANHASWSIISNASVPVTVGARSFTADQAELAGPGGEMLTALRWYWIDDRITSSDVLAKLYMLLSRVQGRDDGAIVIVYAKQDPAARRALDAFLRDAGPALDRILRRASGLR